jgi:hypothetical protein
MSYARRTDANHASLLLALVKYGWYVRDTSKVPNFFDALAIKHGRICFIEIKDGAKSLSRRKLRPNQEALHADFRRAGAEVVVLESLSDLAQLERPSNQLRDDGGMR